MNDARVREKSMSMIRIIPLVNEMKPIMSKVYLESHGRCIINHKVPAVGIDAGLRPFFSDSVRRKVPGKAVPRIL